MAFLKIAPIVHEVVGCHYGHLGSAFGELSTVCHNLGLKREQFTCGLFDSIEELLNALLLTQSEFQIVVDKDEADVAEVRLVVHRIMTVLKETLLKAEGEKFGVEIPADKTPALFVWSAQLKEYTENAIRTLDEELS